jgi:hypothetical protein
MNNDTLRHGAKRMYAGTGARPITLGTVLPEPSNAIHCNANGTAICHFVDGSKATLTFTAGGVYSYRLKLAETAGGTNPTLIAIF